MTDRVRKYIRQYQLLREGDRVTVGLSGGADSVCLLLCMKAVQEEYRLQLQAVHVHHGLRGEEADRDAAFAESLCRKLAVPFRLRHARVRELARREGLSPGGSSGGFCAIRFCGRSRMAGRSPWRTIGMIRARRCSFIWSGEPESVGWPGCCRRRTGSSGRCCVWAVQRSRCIFSRWGRRESLCGQHECGHCLCKKPYPV